MCGCAFCFCLHTFLIVRYKYTCVQDINDYSIFFLRHRRPRLCLSFFSTFLFWVGCWCCRLPLLFSRFCWYVFCGCVFCVLVLSFLFLIRRPPSPRYILYHPKTLFLSVECLTQGCSCFSISPFASSRRRPIEG